jgi:hypothetical protein
VGAPPARASRGVLELLDHGGVGVERGRGSMPGPPIGVRVGREGVGERLMGPAAAGGGGAVVDDRAQQRMAELDHRTAHAHEVGALGAVERVGGDPQAVGRGEHRREVAGVVGGGGQQQDLRRVGQRLHTPEERALHARADRRRGQQRLGAAALRAAQRRRQLDQGERVSFAGLEQPGPDRRSERLGRRVVEQLARRRVRQAAEGQLLQARGVEAGAVRAAGGEDERDAIGVEPAGDERERLGGRRVQPIGVVDEAQHRSAFGGLRQQAQHGDADDEAVLARGGAEAERTAQAARLHPRQPVEPIEDRADERVERRVRQLGLGLDTAGRQHAHVTGPGARRLEQRRLAGAGGAGQDQRAAVAGTCRLQQRVDARELGFAPVESRPGPRRHRRRPVLADQRVQHVRSPPRLVADGPQGNSMSLTLRC